MSTLRILLAITILLSSVAASPTQPELLGHGEWRVVGGGAILKVIDARRNDAYLIHVVDQPSSRHDFTITVTGGPPCQQKMEPIWFFSPDDHFNLALIDLTGDGI